MNQIIQSLMDRKSVRSFTSQEIPENIVQEILEASAQAPTAGNQQLYTILRISDPEKKRRLSISCDNQPFIKEAKLVLVYCADCLKWYRAFEQAGCEPRKPGEGDLMLAVCDAVIAAQNAVVAAQSVRGQIIQFKPDHEAQTAGNDQKHDRQKTRSIKNDRIKT